MNKFVRRLLFVCAMFFIGFSVKTIIETVEYSKNSIYIDVETDKSDIIILDEERNHTLFLSGMIGSNGEPLYHCEVNQNTVTNVSEFTCISYGSVNMHFDIMVESNGEYYYVTDMGNTSLTNNNSVAIGRIDLPAGESTFTIVDASSNQGRVLRVEDSKVFIGIFIIIISILAGIGLMVGSVGLLIKEKNKGTYREFSKESYHRQSQNKSISDEDDPFSQYD